MTTNIFNNLNFKQMKKLSQICTQSYKVCLNTDLSNFKGLVFTVTLLLGVSLLFNGCERETPISPVESSPVTLTNTDRLLSVANVYLTEDGNKVEAWFYETPQVFEFSIESPNGKSNFEMLKSAKEKKGLVNVRLIDNVENMIDKVSSPTSEQIANFKTKVSKREVAFEDSGPTKANVPDIATLNTIFNRVKNLDCGIYGPHIYGQCVPFQYVRDGCYARAHKARQIIESWYGYTSYKVFNYACNGNGTLKVRATLWSNNCCATWWYHVASYVYVGGTRYVIDPSMFSGPVTVSTWVAAQKSSYCSYSGASQGQVYYTSNAYAPSSLNSGTCTLVPFGDSGYTAANSTCAAYASKQGC